MEALLESRLLITLLMILAVWVIKVVIINTLKQKIINQDHDIDKRYIINNAKNTINLLLIMGVFYLWVPEIQQFALSIAAFIVAIVLATKEIIQCFIGFLYLSSTNPYRVGDWIQVGNFFGEVSETDWAKVTLLEVDINSYSYTGRSVFIPNNQFMTQPIKNLNFMKRYVNHNFTLVIEAKNYNFNPYVMKAPLIKKAEEYCQGFYDVAERYNALIEKRLGIKIEGPAPSLDISTTELGKFKLAFSLFCPTDQATNIEQKLSEDFFSICHKQSIESL